MDDTGKQNEPSDQSNSEHSEESVDGRGSSSMESLQAELIMEILSRVPTLDLLKLSSVCRRWRNIFNDPLFRRLHYTRSISNPTDENQVLVLKRRKSETSYLVDLTDKTSPTPPRRLEIYLPCAPGFVDYAFIGSCNGLLCLGSTSCNSIFVTNPCTHQHMHFSILDPEIYSIRSWGFGFDEKNKLFKVVVFVASRLTRHADVEVRVCDLGSGGSINWRSIGGSTLRMNLSGSCFVNGRLHWTYRTDNHSRGILSFDLANEEFRPIPTPDCLLSRGILTPNCLPSSGIFFGLMRSVGGCLCIFYSQILEAPNLQVWIMKEYGVKASWVKEVDTYPLTPKSLNSHLKPQSRRRARRPFVGLAPNSCLVENRFVEGLGFGKNGELVMVERNMAAGEEAILFSVDSKCDEFKHLQVEKPPFLNRSIIHAASLNWI